MSRARAWTGTGWVLLGALGVLGILGAQEPAKVTPEARQKGLFSQFTSRTVRQQSLRQLQDADFEAVKILDFLPAQTIWVCKRPERG